MLLRAKFCETNLNKFLFAASTAHFDKRYTFYGSPNKIKFSEFTFEGRAKFCNVFYKFLSQFKISLSLRDAQGLFSLKFCCFIKIAAFLLKPPVKFAFKISHFRSRNLKSNHPLRAISDISSFLRSGCRCGTKFVKFSRHKNQSNLDKIQNAKIKKEKNERVFARLTSRF